MADERSSTPLAILVSISEASLFTSLISTNVIKVLQGSDVEKIKTAISLVGACAK